MILCYSCPIVHASFRQITFIHRHLILVAIMLLLTTPFVIFLHSIDVLQPLQTLYFYTMMLGDFSLLLLLLSHPLSLVLAPYLFLSMVLIHTSSFSWSPYMYWKFRTLLYYVIVQNLMKIPLSFCPLLPILCLVFCYGCRATCCSSFLSSILVIGTT